MRNGCLKRFLILGLLSCLLAGCPVGYRSERQLCLQALAWDGDWTDAKSGRVGLYDNPGSTDGQAGTDPPQKYYTSSPRDYSEVDPNELDDYFHRYNKNYTPYALARITQDLHYNYLVVPKGYYLVKPGGPHDGSARVNLQTLNTPPSDDPEDLPGTIPIATQTYAQTTGDPATISVPLTNGAPPQKVNPKKPVYEVFVIKRQGKVIAVVPIHRRQIYNPARKDKIPKQALAWVEEENRHPVLKFYFQHWIYSTDFQ